MVLQLFSNIEAVIAQSWGATWFLALFICLFFFIGFLIAGLDFRIVMLIESILVVAFAYDGWFPFWVAGMFWILIVGLGIFFVWRKLQEQT